MSLINIHVHNWQLLLSLAYSTCWQSIALNNVVICTYTHDAVCSCFVADEELRGRSILQLTPFVIATRTAERTSETYSYLPIYNYSTMN